MRVETPLREIPETVSLVTPEQIRVQNLTDVFDALDQVPGLVSANDNAKKIFHSRGYPVTSFHVDGSANGFSYRFPERRVPELAQFERIEVLRGADGLFAGNGQPGASINLIRKRPRHDPTLRVSAWAGSWENHRVEVDTTGPLAFDGALRGPELARRTHREQRIQRALLRKLGNFLRSLLGRRASQFSVQGGGAVRRKRLVTRDARLRRTVHR